MATRILIADDHNLLRAGLRALLTHASGLEVVGEAGTGDEVLALAGRLLPDLVLLDIGMPGKDGLEVTRALRGTCPEMRILILTASEEGAVLAEALRAGAAGYVVKRAVESELVSAIEAVMRGDMYVHPSVTRALLSATAVAGPPGSAAATEPLTPREREVLALLAQGMTSSQIGEVLTLSKRTVESHRANIMGKLHARSRADIVRYAAEHGLLPDRARGRVGQG